MFASYCHKYHQLKIDESPWQRLVLLCCIERNLIQFQFEHEKMHLDEREETTQEEQSTLWESIQWTSARQQQQQ